MIKSNVKSTKPEKEKKVKISSMKGRKNIEKLKLFNKTKTVEKKSDKIKYSLKQIEKLKNKNYSEIHQNHNASQKYIKEITQEENKNSKKAKKMAKIKEQELQGFCINSGKITTDSATVEKKSKKKKGKSQGILSNTVKDPICSTDVEMVPPVDEFSTNDTLSSLPEVGFTWGATMEDWNLLKPDVHEDSDNDEDEVEIKKAKPKLTKAERAAAAKAEEAKVRASEDELLQNGDPVSPDGFDRMLLAHPDSSELWVKYMAYHLQTTEIEKARAVGRRGLTVINIRREEERLNVWTALLNLEHLYGTRDSVQACLHEAVRCNDEIKVYLNLMNIYAASGQIRELDSTVKLLLKKAGTGHSSVNVYLQCANTLLQQQQQDTARHILQRGLNNLPPAVHVTLISRFALAENKYGDSARAQALFEHTLTSYPARTDVWGVYVDMLIKSDRVDLARQVIQRAVSQKLPPKKLKPLYTKWLKLEEQYGDMESLESVKKEIEQYVKDTRGKLNNMKLAL